MSVKVTSTGNGKFSLTGDQSDVIISYIVSEGATPTSMSDTGGEIPSMSITGESNSVQSFSNTHPSSRLLIDNQLTLTDSIRGSFTGRVGSLDISDNSVSANVFSKFEKLNVTKKMPAHNGTLKTAYETYLLEAGFTSGQFSVDSSLTDSVVFPSWTDNIWNGLKLLGIASNTEMYFLNGITYVKPRGTRAITINDIDSESYSISLGEDAKTITLTKGETSWVSNAIILAYGPKDSTESIDFAETKEVIKTTQFSLNSVNQPEYVEAPFDQWVDFVSSSNLGKTPPAKPNGFYAFRGNDGKMIVKKEAEAWGAKVEVSLTDNPYEVKLKITGPNTQFKTPWDLKYFDNYPAFGLTGTGAFVEKSDVTFNTGSAIGDSDNTYKDNPFLINDKYLYNAAYWTNQKVCGPVTTFNFNTDKIVEASNQEFGFLPGTILSYGGSKYRVTSATYNYESISIHSEQYVTFADFNAKWAGKTIAQFNSTMLDPTTYPDEFMKYSDLAILPLMEPTA